MVSHTTWIVFAHLVLFNPQGHGNENELKQWPQKFELYAWLVNIEPSGHLQAHMHKEGWLSGSIYLDVPEGNVKSTSGGISFGFDGAGLPVFNTSFTETPFSVRKRQVVMFPSSLFHRTLPFAGARNRVSLAFDVIPSTA